MKIKEIMKNLISRSVSLQINKYTTKREIDLFLFFLRLLKKNMNKKELNVAKKFFSEMEKNLKSIDVSKNPTNKLIQRLENKIYDLVELEEAFDMIELMKEKEYDMEEIEKILKKEGKTQVILRSGKLRSKIFMINKTEKVKKLKDFSELGDDFSELEKTFFYCQDKNLCNIIYEKIKYVDFPNTDLIHIDTLDNILEFYSGDEQVEERLVNEGNIAMNKGLSGFPDEPRTSLIIIDHPSYEKYGLTKKDIINEIIVTIFHEDCHLSGIPDEDICENHARKRFEKIL